MRSATLSFPAKRANRAMLTSTMRWAFETTMERRRNRASRSIKRWQVSLSRPPHSPSTSWPVARSQAFQIQTGSDFFQIVPHLVELDHHRPALRLGLLGVSLGELLEPNLDGGCRDAQELGGAVHRQSADIEQHGRHLQGQRFAAWGRIGEIQAAGFAQVALLATHEPVLNVLVAPAALTAQLHGQPPQGSAPQKDRSSLRASNPPAITVASGPKKA